MLSQHVNTVKLEVFIPRVHPRIKDINFLIGFGIMGRQAWTFEAIAARAGEAKICVVVVSTVLPSPNVLNVKGDHRRVLLRKTAVLASVLGSLPNKLTHLCVH